MPDKNSNRIPQSLGRQLQAGKIYDIGILGLVEEKLCLAGTWSEKLLQSEEKLTAQHLVFDFRSLDPVNLLLKYHLRFPRTYLNVPLVHGKTV